MSSTERTRGQKAAAAGLWVLIVLELLGMGLAGLSKFQGDGWPRMFEGWGYPAWFASVIGAAEISGVLMLTVRKFSSYAAMLLIFIMLGAIWTVLTNESQLGPGMPTIHITILSIILAARWKSRWRPGRAHAAQARA